MIQLTYSFNTVKHVMAGINLSSLKVDYLRPRRHTAFRISFPRSFIHLPLVGYVFRSTVLVLLGYSFPYLFRAKVLSRDSSHWMSLFLFEFIFDLDFGCPPGELCVSFSCLAIKK